MIGYHYSNVEIQIGDTIVSDQHKGKTFELVHNVFKKVNNKLPDHFGYAYPYKKEKLHTKHNILYIVESDFHLLGNLHYSVYYTMGYLSQGNIPFISDKTIPLKERLKAREMFLLKQANSYFNLLDNKEYHELISDSWVVKDIIKF